MKTMRLSLGMLPPAALVVLLVMATAPAAAAGRQAVPKQGDAPQVRVESSSSSSGGAARTRPSSPSSRGSSTSSRGSSGSGTVSRTRPPSGSAGSGAPTQVDRNPDRYRRYYHRPYGYRYYDPYYSASFYLGYYPPYYYWPWGYWGAVPLYYPAYHPRYYYGGPYYGEDAGALDLDVSPEKAEVWLDGRYIGVADQFDGFPEYLWLPEDTYDVIFYKEGYQTIHRQYSIYPGVVIDVEDRMLPGDSVRPEDLAAPKSTVRREERLQRDEERRQEAGEAERTTRRAGEPFDARGEPGRLRLEVRPEDASIYLDGRFLGTAEELASLHAGLIVDPGEHRLEVVRPGYESDEVELEVAAGEEVTVQVTLEEG